MNALLTVVGLGEILWDLLPSGRQLGGAPANFAYCSHLLGDRAVVASRIGADELGREIREWLAKTGITNEYLQTDPSHATGTVHVQLDSAGQPKFEITQPVAWDFMEWTNTWQALAESADAVCFGSLAQRSAKSRSTVLNFLDAMRPNSLRIFDVNLRQNFYSAGIISDSLQRANAVKLNHEEVPRVREFLGIYQGITKRINNNDELAFSRRLIEEFGLGFVCITRGANGSLLCDRERAHEHPGFRVQVKDTVGAGDAFTAGLVHGYLRGHSLPELNESANRLGAWVAAHSGAMPQVPERGLERALMQIR